METPSTERPPARLGLWDTASIIVGIIIGVGIFKAPADVLRNVAGPWEAMAVWALGGLLAFGGALCFAELSSTYPRSGGDYVYLSRAYGPALGFLFGWAQLAVLRTAGSIAVVAYVFADYAARLLAIDLRAPHARFTYAGLAVAPIVVLSVINLLGVTFGKHTQNFLTILKTLGLGAIVVVGFFWTPATPRLEVPYLVEGRVVRSDQGRLVLQEDGSGRERSFALDPKVRITVDGKDKTPTGAVYAFTEGWHTSRYSSAPETCVALVVKVRERSRLGGFALAMILVLWTYAGWHEGAYVASEIRNPRRNLPLALLLATTGVTALYLLVNAAYLTGLGVERAEDSQAVAADILALAAGALASETAMSLLVVVSALGGINGVIITSSRIYAEMAADHRLFAPLARWSPRWRTPARSLVVQALICVAMIGVVGVGWEGQEDGFQARS